MGAPRHRVAAGLVEKHSAALAHGGGWRKREAEEKKQNKQQTNKQTKENKGGCKQTKLAALCVDPYFQENHTNTASLVLCLVKID